MSSVRGFPLLTPSASRGSGQLWWEPQAFMRLHPSPPVMPAAVYSPVHAFGNMRLAGAGTEVGRGSQHQRGPEQAF